MSEKEEPPIYVQLKRELIGLILEGHLKDGDVVMSVRQLATLCDVNPLTVSKAYQELQRMGVIEKRRGVGMFIQSGASRKLLKTETEHFLKQEWPHIHHRINQLGLKVSDLPEAQSLSPSLDTSPLRALYHSGGNKK